MSANVDQRDRQRMAAISSVSSRAQLQRGGGLSEQQQRRTLCYPQRGRPDANSLVACLSQVFDGKPYEIMLEILERLDPCTFAICRHLVKEYHAVYCDQLRKLLHDSPFAQMKACESQEARSTYYNILAARHRVLESSDHASFPHTGLSKMTILHVAPDCCSYFTLNHTSRSLDLWRLTGESIERFWSSKYVVNAGYLQTNSLWTQKERGLLELWSFTEGAKLDASWDIGPLSNVSLSSTFLFECSDDETYLWRRHQRSQRTEIRLPDRLAEACHATFAPDDSACLFATLNDLYFVKADDLGPDAHHTPLVRKHDGLIKWIHFSPNGRKFIAVGLSTIELWYHNAIEQTPIMVDYTPVEGSQELQLKRVAFSSDSHFVFAVLQDMSEKDTTKSNTLVVFQDQSGRMEQIYSRSCGDAISLAPFLDRFLFVGPTCLDLGDILERDM